MTQYILKCPYTAKNDAVKEKNDLLTLDIELKLTSFPIPISEARVASIFQYNRRIFGEKIINTTQFVFKTSNWAQNEPIVTHCYTPRPATVHDCIEKLDFVETRPLWLTGKLIGS